MKKNARIYVAGHTGLVGSAIVRALKKLSYQTILTRSHQELELTDQVAVAQFFESHKPEYVVLAAAKVGGIYANSHYPADFIAQNLNIQSNVIHQAKIHGVKRLLFLGSSCIYPRECSQPIKEEYLLSGSLEPTNRPYALAKIAGIEMCWAYNRQYGTQYLAAMPTNLYGPGDNYDLKSSHVIPALIRKMHEAKIANKEEVEIWGTGTPRREFLYSDDLAEACIFLLNLDESKYSALVSSETQAPLVNVGCGEDITIAELANVIASVVGFEGKINYNTAMPDGTPRKLLCVEKMQMLGWQRKTNLVDGLKIAYQEYMQYKQEKKTDCNILNEIS
ncbi:GDP-L-fucose synthase [Candidatus Berkiella cookevillensis]|uniref:GDP-L-fucose synthase n=1 Tax=Candidatus Berkiella cookevillensis TaxID=437022 RepID=A0A0Q9YGH9_9GAMM|nr:GDP-L-fucose synthase [Candidatus Berkiella cookevillensis]MCS5707672.1 GDP-L-fucose synthase [Candidatus Berkiella cookevillensis]